MGFFSMQYEVPANSDGPKQARDELSLERPASQLLFGSLVGIIKLRVPKRLYTDFHAVLDSIDCLAGSLRFSHGPA